MPDGIPTRPSHRSGLKSDSPGRVRGSGSFSRASDESPKRDHDADRRPDHRDHSHEHGGRCAKVGASESVKGADQTSNVSAPASPPSLSSRNASHVTVIQELDGLSKPKRRQPQPCTRMVLAMLGLAAAAAAGALALSGGSGASLSPLTVDQHQVAATLLASGDVSDYDVVTREGIAQVVADACSVPVTAVRLTVAPASVRISIVVTMSDESTAAAVGHLPHALCTHEAPISAAPARTYAHARAHARVRAAALPRACCMPCKASA